MGQLIDEGNIWMTGQDGVEVHLLEWLAPVLEATLGELGLVDHVVNGRVFRRRGCRVSHER